MFFKKASQKRESYNPTVYHIDAFKLLVLSKDYLILDEPMQLHVVGDLFD